MARRLDRGARLLPPRQLTWDGLIDQYRLMVYPVVVGSGKRLFSAASATTLRIVDPTTTSAGVVLTYNTTASAA